LGNQDLAVLRFLQGEKGDYNKAQKRAARELSSASDKYIEFLSSLPLTIDLGEHFVVHAGVRPGVPLTKQEPDDLLELRTLGEKRTRRKGTPWYEVYDGEKYVLFGHWPQRQPRHGERALGLDTGCVYGHRLTAYWLETEELISVPAQHAYTDSSHRFERSAAKQALPQRDETFLIRASTNLVQTCNSSS
jgi:hypothetical protein